MLYWVYSSYLRAPKLISVLSPCAPGIHLKKQSTMSAKRLSLVYASAVITLSFAAVLYALYSGRAWPLYAFVITATAFSILFVYTLFKGVFTPLQALLERKDAASDDGAPPEDGYSFKEIRLLADYCSKLSCKLHESRLRQKELTNTIEEHTRMTEELRAARLEAEETSGKLQKSIRELEEFALMAVRRELKMREIREKFKRCKDEYESGPGKRGLI